jgi:tripartite-type tricarboxylate transporter receptor subunit TctC
MNVTRRQILRAGGAAMAAGTLPSAFATTVKYPDRPIELIVPWGPGGGADQLARLTGKLSEPILTQSMPIINVPGGTGATGMAKLLAAPADGHSAAIYIADSHALLVGKDARWSMDSITPVAVMIQAPSFLFVPQNSRFKSWSDFAAEAKERPGQLKVATLGFGSVDDFTLTYLGARGIKVVQVPFSKPSERYISILGGHADALYEQAGDVAQFLNSGQMKPLIVFANRRFEAFKDVPSSKELGIDITLPQFRAIVLRGGTQPERVKIFSDTLAKVAALPDFRKFLTEQFADENSFLPAEQATVFIKQQLEDMRAAVKQS